MTKLFILLLFMLEKIGNNQFIIKDLVNKKSGGVKLKEKKEIRDIFLQNYVQWSN